MSNQTISNKYIENAEEKLGASRTLLKVGYANDSISRSYYSMFFAAKALLALRDIYPKSHQGVITQLGLEFVKNGFLDSVYGRAIRKAKEQRETADYDIDIEFSLEEAERLLKTAEDFLLTIKCAIRKLLKENIEKT